MGNFYIRVVNGEAFEHPLMEENLRQVIPNFDPDNLPPGLEKIERKPIPQVKFLETYVGSSYQKIDGAWQEVHNVRPLTKEQIAAKIDFAKMTFLFSDTWTLNTETGEWIPPVPYPNDGKPYLWNNEKQKWEEFSIE